MRPRDGYDDGYSVPSGRASTGRASAGRASAGRASVGSASVGSAGRASVGSASVGSASVGNGYDGAASGRATVGRASILAPDRPGAPGGPGGPDGPGGGRRAAGRPGGPKKRNKKRLRRNIILAACSVFIILSGFIVVGGTYYFDSVKMPNQLPTPDQTTTIYYSDNVHEMARIGTQNRTYIPISQIPKSMQYAVVAAEDNTFYTNSGVSYRGVLRAAWNNLTGGDREGASTITQQYARSMADLEGISYARKLREAVIAMKLSKNYSKDAIMEAYLNTVYFGRGAYGIEAAAEAYFKKHAKDLTIGESMLLAGVIRQPEPADPDNPSASPGYDPAYGKQQSMDRWGNYIKPKMKELGFMTKLGVSDADYDKLTYPTDWVPLSQDGSNNGEYGLDQPTGFVVHQVMSELTQQKDVPALANPQALKTGGYRIVTTIDYNMEQDAINIANADVKGSVMSGQPKNLQASLVSIQPGTGRVLAYYGGNNGSGLDYAGIWDDPVTFQPDPNDPNSKPGWSGAHFPPGSTFKIYTLATALSQGIGIDSYWNGPPSKEFPDQGRTKGTAAGPVTNADGDGDSCPKNTQPVQYVCTLQYALQESMNTVFFGVGVAVGGPANIINMAKAMGIKNLWDGNNVRYDLTKSTGAQLAPHFGYEISIGQYGTTVLDNADGVATIASGHGTQAAAHFVQYVYQGANLVYKEKFQLTNVAQTAHLTQQELDDETWAMSTVIDKGVAKNKLANGRPAAAKTGTWQYGNTDKNQDAWYAGFTPQLATVVHIGSSDTKQPTIQWVNTSGHLATMNGADLPGTVWKKYMDAALKGQKNVALPSAKHVGDPDKGNAQSPQPQAPPNDNGGNQGNNPGPGTPAIRAPGTPGRVIQGTLVFHV